MIKFKTDSGDFIFTVNKTFFKDMAYEACHDGFLDIDKLINMHCVMLTYESGNEVPRKQEGFIISEAWNKIECDAGIHCKRTYVTLVLERDQDRQEYFIKQRKEQGFSNDELWNYDTSFLDYIISRLEAFKTINPAMWVDPQGMNVYPEPILQEMIDGFKLLKKDSLTDQEWIKAKKAWKLLEHHFFDLWY